MENLTRSRPKNEIGIDLGNRFPPPLICCCVEMMGWDITLICEAAVKDDNGPRPVELFMCTVVNKMGYAEAFDWLSKLV